VHEEQDLGVIISVDLKASLQCVKAYSTANRILGVINRLIVKDKELLERVQRRFTRMIPELKQLAYADRLDSLKLWTLEERRVCADLIEVYKIVHGLSAIPFSSFFEFENSGRTRGHSLKLRKKRCRLDLSLYFFSERVVSLWNCLDERAVKSASLNCFKGNLTRLRSSTMGQLFLDSFVR